MKPLPAMSAPETWNTTKTEIFSIENNKNFDLISNEALALALHKIYSSCLQHILPLKL